MGDLTVMVCALACVVLVAAAVVVTIVSTLEHSAAHGEMSRFRDALDGSRPIDPADIAERPWELMQAVLKQGRADGLNDVQLAGGLYAVLVSHGLMRG